MKRANTPQEPVAELSLLEKLPAELLDSLVVWAAWIYEKEHETGEPPELGQFAVALALGLCSRAYREWFLRRYPKKQVVSLMRRLAKDLLPPVLDADPTRYEQVHFHNVRVWQCLLAVAHLNDQYAALLARPGLVLSVEQISELDSCLVSLASVRWKPGWARRNNLRFRPLVPLYSAQCERTHFPTTLTDLALCWIKLRPRARFELLYGLSLVAEFCDEGLLEIWYVGSDTHFGELFLYTGIAVSEERALCRADRLRGHDARIALSHGKSVPFDIALFSPLGFAVTAHSPRGELFQITNYACINRNDDTEQTPDWYTRRRRARLNATRRFRAAVQSAHESLFV
jgi:hypothetical protein